MTSNEVQLVSVAMDQHGSDTENASYLWQITCYAPAVVVSQVSASITSCQ
jgi:hypothetical protein